MSSQVIPPAQKEESPMRVGVRFRPFLKSEVESCGSEKPKCCAAFHKNGKNILIKHGVSNSVEFTFERILKTTNTQEDVFATCGHEMMQRVLKGQHCTLFSFGAYQTGKTFTLFGNTTKASNWASESEPQKFDGIVPRFIRLIFNYIMNESPENIEFSVSLNAFEICGMENGMDALMNDLLKNSNVESKLDVLVEEETNVVEIVGLTEVFVTSDVELFESVAGALAKRSKKHSSAFFEIKFVQHDTQTNLTKESRFTVIDLDAERPSDPHRTIRQNGCKVFQDVAEALYSESDEYDYFSTTLKCLLFSRVFVNTASFAFVTLSPMTNVVEEQTIPFLQLASKINELSSDVTVNYIQEQELLTEEEISQQELVPQQQAQQTISQPEIQEIPKTQPVIEEQPLSSSTIQEKPQTVVVEDEKIPSVQETAPKEESHPQPSTLKEATPKDLNQSLETSNTGTIKASSQTSSEKIKEIPQPQVVITPSVSVVDVKTSDDYQKLMNEALLLVPSLESKISSLKEQLELEEEKTAQLERKILKHETQSKETKKQLKESQSLLEQAQKERDRFEKQFKESQEELQQLKEKLINEESNRDELAEKLAEFEKNNQLGKNIEEDYKSQIQKLQKEVQELKESSKKAKPSVSTPLDKKSEEIEQETISHLKAQFEELKSINAELSSKLDQVEKKNIELEEELVEAEKKALEADDPSHQLIEKLKSKNKLLLEQLNAAKRENLKAREKTSETSMKTLEVKISEFQQLVSQFSSGSPSIEQTVIKSTTATDSQQASSNAEEDDLSLNPQEKLNMQKLKEKVTDLTNKLSAARKKSTEMEIARMKWQEGEKTFKQKITHLENEMEELRQKFVSKENSLKEEIDQLHMEINTLKENEQKLRNETRKLEKEKKDLEQTIKTENANRKKSVMVLQQVHESNNGILRNELVQAKEKIEMLERELKKQGILFNTGSALMRSQSISPTQSNDTLNSTNNETAVVTPPKTVNENSEKKDKIPKQQNMNSKRISVRINKNTMQQVRSELESNRTQQQQQLKSPSKSPALSTSSLDSMEDVKHVVDEDDEEYDAAEPTNSATSDYNPQLTEGTISENVKPKFDKNGNLYKKGPKINIFKKRFFKMDGHHLYYFHDAKDLSKPLGVIDLRVALSEIAPEKSSNKRRFVFKVEIPGKIYYMSAPSKEDRDEWVVSLQQLIQKLKDENSF
ncbi:hypothetical protein C9374_000742 [Naegleria lovaniensis]|uniref:Uncharacterized protein n=1 Tax=Naegleria lovaniensis TaxID=51637 RepID=A0AA88GS57_NAELO|nr:uncharacterized protein C9374_000742 [Naegleria lovaniensis]KAG2387892.1 hypothetical protein C9374_000742 [Naegleria lovaniensis]